MSSHKSNDQQFLENATGSTCEKNETGKGITSSYYYENTFDLMDIPRPHFWENRPRVHEKQNWKQSKDDLGILKKFISQDKTKNFPFLKKNIWGRAWAEEGQTISGLTGWQQWAQCGAGTHKLQDHDLSQSRMVNQLSHPGAPTKLKF